MNFRLAQGPIHILEDQYDETFISDSRGKFNRTLPVTVQTKLVIIFMLEMIKNLFLIKTYLIILKKLKL